MKKLVSLILAVLMIAALSTTAFAAEGSTTVTRQGYLTNGIDVYGTYESAENAKTVSVEISWGAMSFTYTPEDDKVWNPQTHQYDIEYDGEKGWSAYGNTITFTNHSNHAINVDLSFVAEANTNITGGFGKYPASSSEYTVDLASAVGTEVNNAPTNATTFTVTGGSISANGKLGTIRVNLVDAS